MGFGLEPGSLAACTLAVKALRTSTKEKEDTSGQGTVCPLHQKKREDSIGSRRSTSSIPDLGDET
eukprot:1145631-Pelagomonas_calceolata.AAC.18